MILVNGTEGIGALAVEDWRETAFPAKNHAKEQDGAHQCPTTTRLTSSQRGLQRRITFEVLWPELALESYL